MGCLIFSSISACTMRPLSLGMTKAEVSNTWGNATRVVDTPGGQRWEYSAAKEGSTNFLLDFNSANQLIAQRQGLVYENFGRILPEMSRSEVELLIGEAFWTVTYFGLPEQSNHIWRWRSGTTPMCFSVRFNKPTWTVIDSGWYPEIKPGPGGFGEPKRC